MATYVRYVLVNKQSAKCHWNEDNLRREMYLYTKEDLDRMTDKVGWEHYVAKELIIMTKD
jgi:hypothetical protein